MTLMHRRARISASTLRARSILEKAAVAAAVDAARAAATSAAGRLRVPVDGHIPDGAGRRGLRALRRRRQAREDRPRAAPA